MWTWDLTESVVKNFMGCDYIWTVAVDSLLHKTTELTSGALVFTSSTQLANNIFQKPMAKI